MKQTLHIHFPLPLDTDWKVGNFTYFMHTASVRNHVYQEESKTEEVAAIIHSSPHVCGHWIDLCLFISCSMVDCCNF